MRGIVGIVEKQAGDGAPVELAPMEAALAGGRSARMERTVSGSAAIAAIAPSSMSNGRVIAHQDGVVLTVCGTNAGRSDDLLRVYRENGSKALCGLEGPGLIVIWIEPERKLVMVNDHLGLCKLYYWFDSERFVFGTQLEAVAVHPAVPRMIDEEALACFLSVGYPLDDLTMLRGVRLMPPGRVMTYQDGKLAEEVHWKPRFRTEHRSNNGMVDQLSNVLSVAVERTTRHADVITLPLSGGLDSRTILGKLARLNKKIHCASYGHDGCYDIRFGRDLAAKAKVGWDCIPLPENYMELYSDEGVRITGGEINCHAFHVMALAKAFEPGAGRSFVSGFLGDCLTGAHLFPELESGPDNEAAARYVYRKFYNRVFVDDELSVFLRPQFRRNVESVAYDRIRRTFLEAGADSIAHRCDAVDLYQRQRRFIAYQFDILSFSGEVIAPFASRSVIEFCLSLPDPLRFGQVLYKQMLRTHHPELAAVGHAQTGAPLDQSRIGRVAHRQYRRFKRRVLPKWTLGYWKPHNYRAYAHYDDWIRGASRNWFEKVLGQAEFLEDHFNIDKVEILVKDHMNGRVNAFEKMCALATFVIFRKSLGARFSR